MIVRYSLLNQYWRGHLKLNDTVVVGLPSSAIACLWQRCIQMLHKFCIELVASPVFILRWCLLLILILLTKISSHIEHTFPIQTASCHNFGYSCSTDFDLDCVGSSNSYSCQKEIVYGLVS